ncbi:hypothetical protein BGZ51_008654 [Haplosporangium sp. Z 767]|nr:hypothetical protein BGZ51_008654 [Haplosporangium sp. Z 767]
MSTALDDRLPQEAVDMLFEKVAGRFRPAAVAMEKIVERNEQGAWKVAIDDTEDRLVSWAHREIKGNLCYELRRLHNKCNKYSDQLKDSIDNILSLLFYNAACLESTRAVENNFVATDPYFKKAVRQRLISSTAADQGCVFEQFMMSVFSETFNTQPLSDWPHQPPISEMCPALVGKVDIVGWREPGLDQGTTYMQMMMKDFMDAHVNH